MNEGKSLPAPTYSIALPSKAKTHWNCVANNYLKPERPLFTPHHSKLPPPNNGDIPKHMFKTTRPLQINTTQKTMLLMLRVQN